MEEEFSPGVCLDIAETRRAAAHFRPCEPEVIADFICLPHETSKGLVY